jgi:GT2 family glycosyltransferase
VFFRIVRNGYRVVYAPESVVYHPITHAEDEAKRRRRARVRSSAAYMILLFVEYREYRRRLLRMLSNALRRRTPSWRDVPSHDRLNAFELLAVTASAPLLYLRTRLRSRRTV